MCICPIHHVCSISSMVDTPCYSVLPASFNCLCPTMLSLIWCGKEDVWCGYKLHPYHTHFAFTHMMWERRCLMWLQTPLIPRLLPAFQCCMRKVRESGKTYHASDIANGADLFNSSQVSSTSYVTHAISFSRLPCISRTKLGGACQGLVSKITCDYVIS